jgi:hypothetical protein
MKAVSDTLVGELRRKASEGASVPDMLRLLYQQLGPESAYSTRLAKYFMAAFDLPLRSVSPIGGWAPDSKGEISDERIQELIYPEILEKKQRWQPREERKSSLVTFASLTFVGTMDVTLEQSPEGGDVVGPAQQPTWPFLFRFGTTSPPERLKIDAPRICLECKVRVSGTGNVDDWEVGILQSISQASWVARYSNDMELKYRLKINHGMLRDGKSTDFLFSRKGHALKQSDEPEVYEVQFCNIDVPRVTFVTQYGGGLLRHTEGNVHFHSFLAVENKRTRSILTLAECHWTLTWDGTYNFATKAWTPDDAEGVIKHNESLLTSIYEKPNEVSSLPFSLDPALANDRKEVWTPDGWKPCKEGLPC